MPFVLKRIEKRFLAEYVSRLFHETWKVCPLALAEQIYDETEGHTYYVQKLSHIMWDKTDKTATDDIL